MKPVILGAGLAGLTVALALAPLPVVLVSPRKLGEGCSSDWAQGGVAASIGPDDSIELHAEDTLAAGGGLNDSAIVTQTVSDSVSIIERLLARGVAFDRDSQGMLSLALEAAHQRRRIVHAKDATGHAIMQALTTAVRATSSIEVIENTIAQELIACPDIAGVILRRGDEHIQLSADCIILATGGSAALWRDSTNPYENWGSGLALAARAGATLGDLEFMQFHPTAINIGRDPMPLASEALRGEGAILIDDKGQRFIHELQPRDIVARAIAQKIADGHRVFLDASQALGDGFAAHFPTIHALCLSAHIDPSTTPIPICPAAHYHMGGVITDARGRTDITGLWACGEVACTGLHGANRLASNSLLEAASFGQRVAEDIKTNVSFQKIPLDSHPAPHSFRGIMKTDKETEAKIRITMSTHIGVTRHHNGLEQALAYLSPLIHSSDRALVGAMISLSALRRHESRGAHCRIDFPQTQPVGQRSHLRLTDLESSS